MLRVCVTLSIVIIVIFGVCGVIAYSLFRRYEYTVEQEKAIYGGNIVEAEYTKVDARSSRMPGFGSSTTKYVLCYEVTYEGQVYSGYNYELHFSAKQKAEAESYIGQKVNIYVGEKAASIIVGETPNIYGAIIPAIVCTAVMTALVLFVIWMLATIIYNRRKNSKMEEIEQEEAEVQNSPSE